MQTEPDWDNDLLVDDFSNEICDLPPIGTYKRKTFRTPPEIEELLERSRETNEAEFRRWLIKNKPAQAVMTPIETSTATGVPDIFACYNGVSSWIECKVLVAGQPKFRGTQYTYLKKLIKAGGLGKIVIQRINAHTYKPSSIAIYDARDIVTKPADLFKHIGQDMVFPAGTEPWYTWHYKSKEDTIEELYQRLLLDSHDFTW